MIAILGCGPSGLLAAHACRQAGVEDVRIYSKKRKSHLYGAQYMGTRIPGIEMGHPMQLRYSLEGAIEQYRIKVYGPDFKGIVSPQDFEGTHPAWDIRAMYDRLWELYSDLIEEADIDPGWVVGTLPIEAKVVFSSIPKNGLCFNKDIHRFPSQLIRAMGDAPGIQKVEITVAPNTITCFGQPEIPFYRAANVFGHSTIEWPYKETRLSAGAVVVEKPIHNNCDCWRGRLINIGRYGKWEKGVLVHSVYEQVLSVLNAK